MSNNDSDDSYLSSLSSLFQYVFENDVQVLPVNRDLEETNNNLVYYNVGYNATSVGPNSVDDGVVGLLYVMGMLSCLV